MANLTHGLADQARTPFLGGLGGVETRVIELDVGTDDLTAAAQHNFILLPADTIVKSVYFYSSDVDTDGTPAVLFNVIAEDIDGGNTTVLLADSEVGRAGGWEAADANLPLLTLPKPFYIAVAVDTVPDAAAAGTLKVVVEYVRSRS